MPFVQPSTTFTSQIFAKIQHFHRDKNFHDTAVHTQNTLKMLSLFPLLRIFDSPLPTRYLLYFLKHYIVPILPFPEGREGAVGEHSEQNNFLFSSFPVLM
jgi:hypothetical protein